MREQFERDGFLILPGLFADDPAYKMVVHEIERIGRLFDPMFTFANASASIKSMHKNSRDAYYRGMRYLRTITQMACHPTLINLSRELGLIEPAVMHSYNIRMDLPNEDKFLFHWHQDSAYLLGSANALTYWIPLVPVSPETVGSIAVIPGSHREGIRAYRTSFDEMGGPPIWHSLSPKDLHLCVNPDPSLSVDIIAFPGDVVVFSQLLLHASLPNRGNSTRWTIQVRHSDLADPNFISAGYPMGDYTNIVHHHYLPGWKPGLVQENS
jgi:hypothetical protein